jgi:hypothetical protein
LVAAISKRREEEQRRKRESGVRVRRSTQARHAPLDSDRSAAGDAPGAGLPSSPAPSAADPDRSAAATDRSIREEAMAIELLLERTSERLSRMTASPLSRELGLVVERYRHSVGEWAVQPPTLVQRIILLDCVRGLHDRVVTRSAREPPRK